jgi:hypothetical protein
MSSRSAPLRSFAILLFKNDLRLHDNEMLARAVREGVVPVPLFVFDSSVFGTAVTHWHQLPRTAPYRARFVVQAVEDLRSSLRKLGSDLLVRFGSPTQNVLDLVHQLQNVSSVWTEREQCTEEEKALEQLRSKLENLKIPVKTMTYSGATLVSPWGCAGVLMRHPPAAVSVSSSLFIFFSFFCFPGSSRRFSESFWQLSASAEYLYRFSKKTGGFSWRSSRQGFDT